MPSHTHGALSCPGMWFQVARSYHLPHTHPSRLGMVPIPQMSRGPGRWVPCVIMTPIY